MLKHSNITYVSPISKKYRLSADLEVKSRLLALAGDPTRIRILCVLFQNKEVCVGDIAESLDMTISAISHQLQLFKDNGLVETKRMGQMICYSLKENGFTRKLKKIVCDE